MVTTKALLCSLVVLEKTSLSVRLSASLGSCVMASFLAVRNVVPRRLIPPSPRAYRPRLPLFELIELP